MRSQMILLFVAAVLLALVVVGCSTTPERNNPDPASLVGKWRLTRLGDQIIQAGPNAPFIEFGADNTVSGLTGVNRFTGKTNPAELAAGRVSLDQLATTRRAGLPEAMDLETKYLRAMAGSTQLHVTGNQLVLSNQDADLLTFERVREK